MPGLDSSAPRPLIGIDGVLALEESPRLVLATRYAEAILKAGGIPVAVPPVGLKSRLFWCCTKLWQA